MPVSITCRADQNNVIDLGLYQYNAHIYDQGHTNAITGTRYYAIELLQTSIPDARRSR